MQEICTSGSVRGKGGQPPFPTSTRARPSLGKEDACRALQRKPFNGTQWVTNPIRQSWRPPEPSLGAAKLADVPMGVSPIDGDAQ